MALIIMLLRKMAKNRWLVGSLLTGMMLSAALASTMPIYKEAILQRMLIKELEQFHVKQAAYPGTFAASATVYGQERQDELIRAAEQLLRQTVLSDPDFKVIENIMVMKTESIDLVPADPARVDPEVRRVANLVMRSGLEEHVELISGRMPAKEPVDGVLEVLVIDRTLGDFETVLDTEFVIEEEDAAVPLRLKPVGVIREQDLNDLYWDNTRLASYGSTLFLSEELFRKYVYETGIVRLQSVNWNISVDYRELDLASAEKMLNVMEQLGLRFNQLFGYNSRVNLPSKDTLTIFADREARLESLLWSLNVPLLLLNAFYLYMVSALLIERQKQEIAVLRSRGAGKLQIVFIFGLESAFLSALAFLAGPWIGSVFTRMLGATSTFMNFVQRKALEVEINGESYLYAGVAALFAFIINMIPVILAARFSIVDQKRNAARETKRSWWHLLGIDFILIALSLYGLFTFRRRMEDLLRHGLDSQDLSVDPMLFAVPAFFIFGFGLLILRVYPWMVRFVYWAGRTWWPPSMYASLLLVARRSNQYHPLMLFLILTLGIGIFNASAARTLNTNLEEQIWYKNGADIVLQQRWLNDAPPPMPGVEPPEPDEIHYLEPPFEVFEKLPGVEHAAKVFVKDDVFARTNGENYRIRLMGIETDDFGRVAWMRQDLLPYHFYHYLNLIAPDPQAVLISRTMAEQLELAPGDTLEINWEGEQFLAVVYGVIDYFPTFNPNPSAGDSDEVETGEKLAPMLAVGHLEMIQNNLVLEPYDVWIKLKEDASVQEFYNGLTEYRIALTKFIDTRGEIVESRNDPFRNAMNGVMSLGFVLSLLISLIGFLLYWILSMQGRMLQLGVFRAMGISFVNMVGMLFTEQLLTSGAGMLIGLASGSLASRIFVPMFQLAFDPVQIVPPFEVRIRAEDTLRLVAMTAIMLAAALAALGMLLKRMKIHQAVKLGED